MGQLEEAFQERSSCVTPSNTVTKPLTELNVITSMDGLTLDGSFIPHSNFLVYQEEEQEPKIISEVVEIARIDIFDSLCDKFPIENNSLSGNPTPFSDYVVESLFPSPIPYGDSDFLVEETGTPHSHFNDSSPEFADELAHIISPPEYDRFYFDLEIVPGDFTRVLKENIIDLSTKGLTINELNDSYFLLFDSDSSLSKEFFEIYLLVSFPSGYEDIIVDPRILIIKGVQSERFYIFPLDDCSIISFVSDSLLLTDPPEIETFLSSPVENEDKVFDSRIFFINGVFSFTRKTPHLMSDNFLIDT
nr:hypothetical protein [Tanacetum cinerariifolium]